MLLGCEAPTLSYLLYTYPYSITLEELQQNLPLLNYIGFPCHNIFFMFPGMSKYESTSYQCTLFDIQCCQSEIRKLVYCFMCRLDSSVNYIILDILVGLPISTSLRFLSRTRRPNTGAVCYTLIVDTRRVPVQRAVERNEIPYP